MNKCKFCESTAKYYVHIKYDRMLIFVPLMEVCEQHQDFDLSMQLQIVVDIPDIIISDVLQSESVKAILLTEDKEILLQEHIKQK